MGGSVNPEDIVSGRIHGLLYGVIELETSI
jgi:hypothetical protein